MSKNSSKWNKQDKIIKEETTLQWLVDNVSKCNNISKLVNNQVKIRDIITQ